MQHRGAHNWYEIMEVPSPILPQFLKSLQPTTNMADQNHWSALLFCHQQPLAHFKAYRERRATHILVFINNTWVNSFEWTKYIYIILHFTIGMLKHKCVHSYTMALTFAGQSQPISGKFRPSVTTYVEYLVIFFFHVLVVSHTCLKHTPMKFYLPYLVRATVGHWAGSSLRHQRLIFCKQKGLKHNL